MADSNYGQVGIPKPLLEVIDLIIKTHNPLAFRSRSEFVVCAVRDYLGRVDEHTKRIDETLHRVASGRAMAKLRERIDDPS